MRTVNLRRGDVMSGQKSQEVLARTNSRAISPEQRAKSPVTLRHGHEEWQQRIEGDWQSHLETLQRCVAELARKNQQLRTALVSANEPKREYRNAVNL